MRNSNSNKKIEALLIKVIKTQLTRISHSSKKIKIPLATKIQAHSIPCYTQFNKRLQYSFPFMCHYSSLHYSMVSQENQFIWKHLSLRAGRTFLGSHPSLVKKIISKAKFINCSFFLVRRPHSKSNIYLFIFLGLRYHLQSLIF
jgi:hypothetical protein